MSAVDPKEAPDGYVAVSCVKGDTCRTTSGAPCAFLYQPMICGQAKCLPLHRKDGQRVIFVPRGLGL